jgi:hypothetical protein
MFIAICYLLALAGGAVLPERMLKDNGAGQTHSPLKASPAFLLPFHPSGMPLAGIVDSGGDYAGSLLGFSEEIAATR